MIISKNLYAMSSLFKDQTAALTGHGSRSFSTWPLSILQRYFHPVHRSDEDARGDGYGVGGAGRGVARHGSTAVHCVLNVCRGVYWAQEVVVRWGALLEGKRLKSELSGGSYKSLVLCGEALGISN